MPARQRILQSLARKRDQPIPMVRLKRVVQSMGDRLNCLNHLPKMHRDTPRGRGGIVQFMRETGGHRSERSQLFLLSR
jgi:hypothetical protein